MNWQLLLQKLFDSGMTQKQIAKAAGVVQSTVSDWYRGRMEPKFRSAQVLIKLSKRKAKAAQ